MNLDIARARAWLRSFDFDGLFIEGMGWERHKQTLQVAVDGRTFDLAAAAHKRGVVAFVCQAADDGPCPDHAARRRVERQVSKSVHEHVIIFTDRAHTCQIWQWVRREPGKPLASREHHYSHGQPGDALIQKLQALAFSLEEEETLTLVDVTVRARRAFDVERVTKRFYDRFKAEHAVFLRFLEGIPDEKLERWYASVMLNRLMFIYFIEKKGFLDGDQDYLKSKLALCKRDLGKDRYYRDFLCPLFFEGFAKQEGDRSDTARKLLGKVPYLNGGIFMRHQIEQLHDKTIEVPDRAFEKLFEFFDAYRWHLDERPLRADNEINPDVLGYIFEKYINQKQMGAYYTKEDITGYISQNTVIPFLFDAAREKCKVAFEGERPVWGLLQEDPDRYIYEAVRRGVVADEGGVIPESTLPQFVRDGMRDPKARMFNRDYNLHQAAISGPQGENLALPTETWREYAARRQRCLDLRERLRRGEVRSINDLITYNLDIRQFAQDVVENAEGPELLVAFWNAITRVTVLDPTCGSGAFLFAALNILDPLYEACLERMQFFLDEWGEGGRKHHPNYHKLFTETLKRVEEHPNRRYFVLKSIVVNNLFGVDIMEEAVEICKLRLFLKLVAQIERVADLEPLPDIDFNIRAGNTLVGFASLDEVRKTQAGTLGLAQHEVARIEEEAEVADRAFQQFRWMQTEQGMSPKNFAEAKDDLRTRLRKLTGELDRFLAAEYAISPSRIADKARFEAAFEKWRKSHQPFHWLAEFYGILKASGFDVVIGNPPYVNAAQVRKDYAVKWMATEACPDIYAWVLERVARLTRQHGRSGMICPLSLGFSEDFGPCRRVLFEAYPENWFSSFGRIPSALFNFDVRVRNTIHIGSRSAAQPTNHTTRLHRWFDEARPILFPTMSYAEFTPARWRGRIPKLNTTRLVHAFEQCAAAGAGRLGDLLEDRPCKAKLCFKKVAYNWLSFSHRLPPCYDAAGKPVGHTQFGEALFASKEDADLCFLVLNGKIEFAFWIAVGDDFHVTNWMFEELPIDPRKVPPRATEELQPFVADLAEAMKAATSFKLNARRRVGNFNLAKCRHVTDQSDAIFAEHFGFADVWEDIELLYAQVVKTHFDSEDG